MPVQTEEFKWAAVICCWAWLREWVISGFFRLFNAVHLEQLLISAVRNQAFSVLRLQES
jgi:hypothetical protein